MTTSRDQAAGRSSTHQEDSTAAWNKTPGIGYRWTICALLFFATTLNYLDRQVLGMLCEFRQMLANFQAGHAGFNFAKRPAVGMIGL